MLLTNILTNNFPSVNGYFFTQIIGVFSLNLLQVIVDQFTFCYIINTMLIRKPAPVAGFSVYNGLSTRATKTLKYSNASVTQFTGNTNNSKIRGEVNILKFLSHTNSNSFSFVRTILIRKCTYILRYHYVRTNLYATISLSVRKGVGVSNN